MKIIICIIAILFSLLSILAPLTQLKAKEKRVSNLLMLGGGVLFLAAAILKLLSLQASVPVAIPGAVLICAAAVWNGRQNGKVHIAHHIVRIALCCALVAGFILT